MPRYTPPMPDAKKPQQLPTRILLTGAAGYIGSHTAAHLVEAGCHVVALDDLSAGNRRAVPRAAEFVRGDAADRELVARLIKEHRIEAALHFAARVVVVGVGGKSGRVLPRQRALIIGIDGGMHRRRRRHVRVFLQRGGLRRAARGAGRRGRGVRAGQSIRGEQVDERMDAARFGRGPSRAFGLSRCAISTRPARGWTARLGQESPRATHLVKVACEAACGRRDGLSIFGDDYPTPDGTCVRDYIHVEDLARAHAGALAHLAGGGESAALNCGYGRGSSVREVVACVKKVSGVDFPVRIAPRRAGDPPELVADNARIRALGWAPRHDDLEVICRSAYQWERSLPRT